MKVYTIHWTLHPLKDQQWYENEIKNKLMTPDEVARELDLNFSLSISGKVFTPFKAERHVTDDFNYNKNLPVYRSWDFGKTNCVLYIQRDNYARTHILHERLLEDSTTTEQKRVALADSFELFPEAEFRDICDPAGSDTTHYGGDTDVNILESSGEDGADASIRPDYYRIRELPTRDRKLQARKMVLRDLQSTPGGEEAFTINRSCIGLTKAFQGGYCYKKDHAGNILDRIQEQHPHEDFMDCLFYYYLETDGSGGHTNEVIEPWDNNGGYINPITGY